MPFDAGEDMIQQCMDTGERAIAAIRQEMRARIANIRWEDKAPEAFAPAEDNGQVIHIQAANPATGEVTDKVVDDLRIPDECEITTHFDVFGIQVAHPGMESLVELIPAVTESKMIVALNAALGNAGYKDKDRHWACLAILGEAFGDLARTSLESTKKLTVGEAKVILDFLALAETENLVSCCERASEMKGRIAV